MWGSVKQGLPYLLRQKVDEIDPKAMIFRLFKWQLQSFQINFTD